MSYGSSTKGEEETADTSEPQPRNHNVSVMREFLESNDKFEWPENLRKSSENECEINWDIGMIPLKFKKIISEKTDASIDLCEAGPEISFQKPFVMKTIRDPDIQRAKEITANEVKNMKDLRHPHVTALLATFTCQGRVSMLIFPAACGDLHQFMERMSKGSGKDRVTSNSDNTITVDSDTTRSRHSPNPKAGYGGKHKENDPQEVLNESWPLNITILKQTEMLRGYFVCLSQALSYLHNSDVRHKDIKPENILIDESGSVVLTDFGISRRFPRHTPHATNEERKFTRKYASPEIMKDENTPRDDPSDVFSLGCVFLEMATLLLGKNLNNLHEHYTTPINESSKEEAYHCNLSKVYSWIDCLRALHELKPLQEHLLLGEINVENLHPSPNNHMIAALIDIRQMLDETPSKRPISRELWQKFQHISEKICGDCDPRRPADIWKPSAMQQRDAQTGLNNRRSLHAIEEKNIRIHEQSESGDLDSPRLSNRLSPDRSLRRSRRGSSPSMGQQKYSKHGQVRTRLEPELPTLQLNGEVREGVRALRSPSLIQRKETVPEDTNPEVTQPPANTSPANVIHDTFTDVGHQISTDVGSIQSPQSLRPPATMLDLSDQRAIQTNQQPRAFNQRQAIEENKFAEEPEKRTPPPKMPIIVYDVSQRIAYETIFAALKGA